MPRQPRAMSENGVYHVVFRGANKQDIFREDADYLRLKNIILKVKQDINIQIYAYCFMKNHVHLLLRESVNGDISNAMRRILTAYAVWYNNKYSRTGPLTEGRYKSFPVDDETYALTVVRYIHRNPVKAFITDDISDYPYSSYNEYLLRSASFVEIDFILGLLDADSNIAKQAFIEYHLNDENDDLDLASELKNAGILKKIQQISGLKNPKEIALLTNNERRTVISEIFNNLKVSKTKLSEITGISRYILNKILDE